MPSGASGAVVVPAASAFVLLLLAKFSVALVRREPGSARDHLPGSASDFTAAGKPYSYDDIPPGKSDPKLAHFSVAHDLPWRLTGTC